MRSFSVSFRPTVSASSRSSSSSIFSTRSSSFSSQNREPTSLTSRPSPAFSKTTLTFIQPSIPVSTRPTPVALSASDRKATSILPVITPPASSNQDVPPPSFTAAPAGAVNLGFWSNKAAVAGTFTGVGLVAIGIIAILLMACIKKRRNKQPEEDIHRSFLPISSPYDWPPTRARAPGRGRRLMDPFAAGDSVPIRRPFAAASNPGRHGRVYSEEDSLSISDNHTSSGNGYVNYDYSATSSDSWPSLIRTRSAPLHQSLGSPTSTSSLRTGLDLPPAHDPVVPESPISMGALSSVPSLYLDSEQIGRRSRHQVSGASFYADQLHSYYYGENDEPPSSARPFGKAF